MAKMHRKWTNIDDADLLTLIADNRAFAEFVDRYAMRIALLAARVLNTAPPVDLSVAIFAAIRSHASEAPTDAASVRDWALALALGISREYARGNRLENTGMNDDERRTLTRQIEDDANLFRQIEDYIAHHPQSLTPAQNGRVGVAQGHYAMTPSFDDPLPEFEAYE
jgi:hypothetical protein